MPEQGGRKLSRPKAGWRNTPKSSWCSCVWWTNAALANATARPTMRPWAVSQMPSRWWQG